MDKIQLTSKFIDFFKEFDIVPSIRFLNTLKLRLSKKGIVESKKYIRNYFTLSDNPFRNELSDKIDSIEFDYLLSELGKIETTHRINKRLVLLFGAPGTGKTTRAQKSTGDNVIVCHSALLPCDLMEDFNFKSGDPCFETSRFQQAMVNGEKILLDEINLLPYESLRFLQTLLDNKPSIVYKGKTIPIKEGFTVYGTMNLFVNGSMYSLPEPLVDRAYDIKEFSMTPELLSKAL